MDFYESIEREAKVNEWKEKVEKEYGRYGVNIDLHCMKMMQDRIIFQIQLKKQTRLRQVFDKAEDVKYRLQIPLFILGTCGSVIYLVMADKKIIYPNFLFLLTKEGVVQKSKKAQLPYLVGHNIMGGILMIDVAEQPHILLGGSTFSGKTVGLKALISSITYWKSPNQVNLVLIDLGANDLMMFNSLPHLSCPIVNERRQAYRVLHSLNKELERRKELEVQNKRAYELLPRIVLVIDEFPDLFSVNQEKSEKKQCIEIISNLLRRGRHCKVHVVLAAQNPTIQNMKVDLGNVTTRVAFKCAKKNFSEVILGESGAENLLGKGDMLFKAFQYDTAQRVQGIFMTNEEMSILIEKIKHRWSRVNAALFRFVPNVKEPECNYLTTLSDEGFRKDAEQNEILLSEVSLWVISQDKISCNLLQKKFGIGWNRADEIMKRLYSLGLIERLDAKLPRKVLVNEVDDITDEALNCLLRSGVSQTVIREIIQSKKLDNIALR